LLSAVTSLIGRAISSIVFIEGYIQIHLGVARMSILSSVRLEQEGNLTARGDAEFGPALLSCVGTTIVKVRELQDALVLELSSAISLHIALVGASNAPEAFIYEDDSGRIWVT